MPTEAFDQVKMKLESSDVVEQRSSALKELFPEVFTEGKIDFEKLRLALGDQIETGRERYGLTWAGKAEAMRAVQIPSTATLVPVRDESVNWDETENVFIEGENLEVLKLLQKSYCGKVKMIYIDPPYNTGNEFIYPDNYRDSIGNYLRLTGQVSGEGQKLTTNTETSGRYHSNWLNMMYPRLFLARNLLRDDGVIFVSIDDHEIHDLRCLMSEIFGEENFIAELVWEKTRKNDAKLFSVGHEYIVGFAKSNANLSQGNTIWREAKPGAAAVQSRYEQLRAIHGSDDTAVETALQEWYRGLPQGDPSKALSRYKNVDQKGVWRDRDISWPGGGGPRYDVPHPGTGLPCKVPERGWGFATPEAMQDQIAQGLVVFRADHSEPPIRKAYLFDTGDEAATECTEDESAGESERGRVGLQVMPSVVYKQAQVETKYLRRLFASRLFDNPKDHEVIGRLIRYCTHQRSSDIVLDFFAGSGTTADAVLRLNREDYGNRQFILVQLPEPTPQNSPARQADYDTISQLARERIRRVIQDL